MGGVGKCVSSMKVEDQSLNEIEFEFSGHLSTLLAGLDRMRAKTQLTDVTLKTENRTFHVSTIRSVKMKVDFRPPAGPDLRPS